MNKDRKIKIQKIFRTDYIVKSINQTEPDEVNHIESEAEFDKLGNQISETAFDNGGNQIEKYVWKYEGNLKMREDYYSGEGELNEQTEYVYDDNARLAKEIKTFADGLVQSTIYERDDDRISCIIVSDSDEGETSKRTFNFSDDGKTIFEVYTEYGEVQSEIETTKNDEGNVVHRKLNRVPDEIVTEEFMTYQNELLIEYKRSETYSDDVSHVYSYNENAQLIAVHTISGDNESNVAIDFDDKGMPYHEVETDIEGNIVNQVERLYYPETGYARTTNVSISKNRQGIPEHYSLQYHYELWPEE